MRHGLIPNLLDPPRYNCRDATFFFMKACNDYIEETNDYDILKEKVEMKFLSSSQEKHEELLAQRMVRECGLMDIMQEIMERHAWGIKFREWNAETIDAHMSSDGHNVDLWPDWNNGFIYGGNNYNCLTWMDKMGSSEKSSNSGLPASARSGAPIEMTALLYLAVKFMARLYDLEYSCHDTVEIQNGKLVKYTEWAKLIRNNFEKYYWIPTDPAEDKNYALLPELVRRRGVYKDCDRSALINTNYYFRPNVLIA